jgi:hypothetical protein
MRTAAERSRERRSFRLECLEDRNLLSVMKPPAIAAEVVTTTVGAITSLSGRLQGTQATAGLYAPERPGDTSYSLHGSSKPVGFVYVGLEHLQAKDPNNAAILNITKGGAVLTTFGGDQITISYTGTGQIPTHGRTTIHLQGTVTGGTKRFFQAGGTFVANGTVGAGKINLSFNLALTYPKSI